MDATWQWGPLVSVTPPLFSLSPSFSLLFRLSSLLSLLPARRLLARRRCKPPPSSLQTAGGRAAGGAAGGGRLKLGRETGARAGGWLGGRSGSRWRWRLGLPCLAPSAPSPMEGGADPRCLLAGVPALGLAGGSPALLDLLRRRRAGLRLRTACFCSSEQGGGEQRRQAGRRRAGRIEETRERKGIERRKREGVTEKWAPPPRGVHVSKIALQNCWMTKCEQF